MNKKEITISSILAIIFILIGVAFSAGFHYPSEIVPGAFQTGDYSFNGSLGIGTTNPQTKLEILATDISGARTETLRLSVIQTGAGAGPELKFYSGTSNPQASIRSYRAGENDGYLILGTNQAGLMTDVITINNNGNVGIGTINPNPTIKLNIEQTSGNSAIGITAGSAIYFGNDVYVRALSHSDGLDISNWNWESPNRPIVKLGGIYASSGVLNNYFEGNVGIGITTPQEKLEVNGHIIGTPIMGNWYPNVNPSAAAGTYTFIDFTNSFDVSAPTYFTNLGGTNGIRIEKSGYYHIEMRALPYLGGSGDNGHLYLMRNENTLDLDHAFPAVSAGWEDRHSSWKGWINAGDVITSKVYHQVATPYAYNSGSYYTRLTIERLD